MTRSSILLPVRVIALQLGVIALAACGEGEGTRDPQPGGLFALAAEGRVSTDGGATRGVAWGDVNSDGAPDLVVANTSGQWNGFYLNRGVRRDPGGGDAGESPGQAGTLGGDPHFSKESDPNQSPYGVVAAAAGNAEGVSWVDFDGDGDLDLHMVTRGPEPDFLFANEGESGLVPVLEGPLVQSVSHTMACWADVDGDGWLDVFLVGYRQVGANTLLRNHGGGRFGLVPSNGIDGGSGAGRACAWGDPNGDGLPDLVVGNALEPNEMYWNRGDFVFERESGIVHLARHAAYTYGLSWADFDEDGDQDLFVANFDDQNVLYRNGGDGWLEPLRDDPLVTDPGGASKGHAWADYDLDGDLDLFVANGTYGPDMRNFLYLNQGGGRFLRGEEGVIEAHADTSAGVAWADYDLDGDLDLFVANWGSSDQVNRLYRNLASEKTDRSWIAFHLRSPTPNTRGWGAAVSILATIRGRQGWITRWNLPTTGYGSQNDLVVHFGLDDAEVVDSVVVRWPSGHIDRIGELTARGSWVIQEGGAVSSGRPGPDA